MGSRTVRHVTRALKISAHCSLAAALCLAAGYARADEGTPPVVAEQGKVRVGAFADPLGFAIFGPTIGGEIGAGHVSGLAYFRWMNVGLVSQELFAKGDDELRFSYGGGLLGRYYFGEELAGLYVGGGLELLSIRIEDETVEREAYLSTWWIPQVEAGYRFAFGQLRVGVGGALGYALVGAHRTEDLSGGEDPELLPVDTESKPYGAAKLELGVVF
jgi:hypothetical protein